MAYARNSSYRYVSNGKVSTRYKQFLVLLGAIIIGMIISAAVNAIPSSKAHSVANHNNANTVNTLSTRN